MSTGDQRSGREADGLSSLPARPEVPRTRPAAGAARPPRLAHGLRRGDEEEAVAGSAKRERQLARERYLRQQERRAQANARRRRNQQVAAVVVAVALVIGGVVGLATFLGDDETTVAGSAPSATPSDSGLSPSPSATASTTAPAAAGCTYTKAGDASKDVGLPAYDKSKAASYRKPFTATLKTNVGDIVIKMAADKAPCTTNSFRHLATKKFYDSTPCHRLTTANIFVLQCGDPTGSGGGGPGYQFGVENPPADGMYPAGTVAMARTQDPGSNGSQFFLVYKDTQLVDDNGYTVFGTVTKGLDVVRKVAAAGADDANAAGDGAPKEKVTIQSVTIGKG
jgi:peptidyl-prolyl cis-trans isomerase B (cyclophilin B)